MVVLESLGGIDMTLEDLDVARVIPLDAPSTLIPCNHNPRHDYDYTGRPNFVPKLHAKP